MHMDKETISDLNCNAGHMFVLLIYLNKNLKQLIFVVLNIPS
jgi:hypothetical protein